MTLDEYKKLHGMTYRKLAAMLGIPGPSGARTVQRYAEGSRFPPPRMLATIREATNGDVTPNDFVDQHMADFLPPACPQPTEQRGAA